MTSLARIKPYLDRASAVVTTAAQWAWENKPFVVAVAIGVQAGMDYAGLKTPAWLYGFDAALGIGALHSSQKAK